MEVTIKLFASLGKFLPAGSKRNEAIIDIAAGTSVDQLITQLNLPVELTHLVLINGIYIDPEKRDQTTFAPGDEFAVFPPVAGG